MNIKKSIQAIGMLFFLTIFSKAVGFLRTSITAACFGMDTNTDLYNLADGIVNQLFHAFSSAIVIIIVPLFLRQKKINEKECKIFAKSAYISLWVLCIFLILCLFFLSPYIAQVMGHEYNASNQRMLSDFIRVLSLGIAISIITYSLQSLLNANQIYGFPAICAISNSVIVILFSVFLNDDLGLWALVISSPVAYAVQLLILRVRSKEILSVKISECRFDQNIKHLFASMIPIFIGNATLEINGLIDKFLLTGLNEGAITATTYANTLLTFATNIIMIPLNTVLFTDVSNLLANNQKEKIKEITEKSLLGVLLICIPIMVIMIACSYEIVDITYGHGRYSAEAVNLTSIAFSIYSLSMGFHVIRYTLNRILYAFIDTKAPMLIGCITVIIHVISAIILVRVLGMPGIVLSNVIDVIFATAITYIYLCKKYIHIGLRNYRRVICSITVAAIAMFFIIKFLKCYSSFNNLIALFVYTLFGLIIYAVTLLVLDKKIRSFLVDFWRKGK